MVTYIVVGVVSGILGSAIGFGMAACLTSGKVADLESASFQWEMQCRWLQAIVDDLRAKAQQRQEQHREPTETA